MRVIAYCLQYGDGIVLTQGVAAGNEPAVLIRDLSMENANLLRKSGVSFPQ